MTITLNEIRELKDWLVTGYHANRVKAQELDQKYIDDTFEVPFVKEVIKENLVRTGKGFRMVSAPAEHIITSNPQFFRDMTKKGDAQADRDASVAAEGNRWLRILLHQSPQPFKQHVKHLLGRGEAWIYFPHNDHFRKDDVNSLPVNFVILDPLIVFTDRSEEGGVPTRVVVSYQRQASTIHGSYPEWATTVGKETDKVPFFMYFDKDSRYFEAGGGKDHTGKIIPGEPLLREEDGQLANGDGLQENIYGLVPFVHAYSGFGMGSVDGDPQHLAVSRLRYCRSRIDEYTAIKSTLNYITYQYAHPYQNYLYDPQEVTPPPDLANNYSQKPGAFNVLPIGQHGKLERGINMLPDAQLYAYLATIERDIDREDPLGTIGAAIGTSGRQQDMAENASLRRYDTIVENSANSWATAFGLSLRMISKLPTILMPSGLKESDIGENYECRIELRATDPLEQDRLRTLGSRLYQMGEIDLLTNLEKYQGYTEQDARLIMARILADNATRNNPLIAAIMGEQAAREIGMEEQYKALEEQGGDTANNLPPPPKFGSEGGEPREGNVQPGNDMPDMALAQRGARRSPMGTM